jgi:hypothetical protein
MKNKEKNNLKKQCFLAAISKPVRMVLNKCELLDLI